MQARWWNKKRALFFLESVFVLNVTRRTSFFYKSILFICCYSIWLSPLGNVIKLKTAEQFVYSRGQNDIPLAQRDSFIFIPKFRDWINPIIVHFWNHPCWGIEIVDHHNHMLYFSQQFTKIKHCVHFDRAIKSWVLSVDQFPLTIII